MYQLDKEMFGQFVSQLRRERGMTQKELAEELYVSDKAVSKWERGLSLPDVSLLVPLGEQLGVTVTELLECRRIDSGEEVDPEEVVKKVIGLSDSSRSQSRSRKGDIAVFFLCLGLAVLELMGLQAVGVSRGEIYASLGTVVLLTLMFGVYFSFFARDRVPDYYDDNKISAYYHGGFRFNLPGLYINNRNFAKIMSAGRKGCLAALVISPVLYAVVRYLLPGLVPKANIIITLAAVVLLIVPMYCAGKKYE